MLSLVSTDAQVCVYFSCSLSVSFFWQNNSVSRSKEYNVMSLLIVISSLIFCVWCHWNQRDGMTFLTRNRFSLLIVYLVCFDHGAIFYSHSLHALVTIWWVLQVTRRKKCVRNWETEKKRISGEEKKKQDSIVSFVWHFHCQIAKTSLQLACVKLS